MKTTKLSNGNYKFQYKGYTVTISKVEGHSNWFYTYENENGFIGAEDWQSTKKESIESAIEWIDYLTSK